MPVLLLMLLAGCASPQEDDKPTLTRPTMGHASWDGLTATEECVDATCTMVERFDEEPRELKGLGSFVWINVTWQANDPENEELVVTIDPLGRDPPLEHRGRSPLRIAEPFSHSALMLTVRAPDRYADPVGIFPSPAPGQAYHVEAAYVLP